MFKPGTADERRKKKSALTIPTVGVHEITPYLVVFLVEVVLWRYPKCRMCLGSSEIFSIVTIFDEIGQGSEAPKPIVLSLQATRLGDFS